MGEGRLNASSRREGDWLEGCDRTRAHLKDISSGISAE